MFWTKIISKREIHLFEREKLGREDRERWKAKWRVISEDDLKIFRGKTTLLIVLQILNFRVWRHSLMV